MTLFGGHKKTFMGIMWKEWDWVTMHHLVVAHQDV